MYPFLLFRFHIASAVQNNPSDSELKYFKSIHSFTRVTFPALQFLKWCKSYGPDFLSTVKAATSTPDNDE